MSQPMNLTFENKHNPEAGPEAWPDTMWPLDPGILHGLPDQLWPDPEELRSMEYPWQLLAALNRARGERITETHGEAGVTFENRDLTHIEGPVWFGPGATVLAMSKIYGPAYVGGTIGSFGLMRHSLVGTGGLVSAYCEVKASVLGVRATTSHHDIILDSIIGNGVNIAGEVGTANVREDKGTIRTTVDGEKIDTGLTSFGTIIGEGSRLQHNSAVMPGKLIGRHCIVGAGVHVYSNLPDNTRIENPRIEPVLSRLVD